MIDHPSAKAALLSAVAAVLVSAPAAGAEEYIHEDARIRGKEIHSFQDGGEAVSVVLGHFELRLGRHAVTGRDAVLWIRTRSAGGGLGLHDIELYVEGDAKVIEPSGATATDQVMYITIRCLGRLGATGTMSDRPLTGFPLYKRAVDARRGAKQRIPLRGPGEAPILKYEEKPPVRPPRRERPGERPIRVEGPPAPRAIEPVHFHAKDFSSREIGEGDQKRRVTIARGNVYLSQGDPESDVFLELRAQSAVIFSARKPAGAEDPNVPWAPQVRGMEMPGGGEHVIQGVYLSGDVVIARGERSLRGPNAYYDFLEHRALVTEPVFRTIQEQRNIPVYVRADEARMLSEREMVFRNARVSTSEFSTPSYHIGATRAYLKNTTPYDEKGVRLGEFSWLTELENATFNVRDVPVAYWPKTRGSLTQGHSPLRRATVGSHGSMGFGGETQWHLFRLLGLLEPEGFDATLDLNWYERGPFAALDLEYDRETYHGYWRLGGIVDQDENDDFGEDRKNIASPDSRGRILARHKQFFEKDWQVQFELSYLCDENYLEQFFPSEFHAGKEQETLLYAKKQRDNWAFTTLLKYRLNRFAAQAESLPELGFHLVGEPLLSDKLTFFSESRAGLKRFRLPNGHWKDAGDMYGVPTNVFDLDEATHCFARLDTRNEVNLPLHLGPVNVVPYAMGRATYWGESHDFYGADEPVRDALPTYEHCRLYGQVGVRTNTHIWRVFPEVHSRLWDLDGIKHVITPEVVAFLGGGNAQPEELYLFPMDPDVEQHLRDQSGVGFGVTQRWQTKRGSGEERKIVDWMRLAVQAGVYDNDADIRPLDGRFFFYRPEYSMGRNHVNVDYTWNISDTTAFLADMNWDMTSGQVRRWNLGLAVSRDPRLRYYLGVRRINDPGSLIDSSILTAGATYQINEKYWISGFQQIDVDYDGHESMASSLSLIRKFPRWYVGATFVMDHRTDSLGLYVTLWPEGIPEARLGSGRATLLAESDMN